MNKSKYTPGPWKVHLNVPNATIEGHIIKTGYGAECPIASLWVGGGTEGKPRQIANAQLIAAAPKLLEACKAVKQCLKIMDNGGGEIMSGCVFKQLEAAVIEAEKGTT